LKLQIIAFSSISTFQVRLPSGNNQTSLINLIIHIRDTLDCIAEYNMPSMIVASDSTLSSELMNNFRTSPNDIVNNPIIQLLASGNQNTVGQIISSFSQEFNQMNNENIDKAVSSKRLFYLI
jgi:galactose-1-phosphate uridylyltransferase